MVELGTATVGGLAVVSPAEPEAGKVSLSHLLRDALLALKGFRYAPDEADLSREVAAAERFIDAFEGAVSGWQAPVDDATAQALDLYVQQAETIRALLDTHAPHTTGSLQARIAQVLKCRA